MFNYKDLMERYEEDPAFNRAVNLFRKMIEEYGFLPDEIRKAVFLAQYQYQMNHVEQVIMSQDEWRKIEETRKLLQQMSLTAFPELEKELFVKGDKNESR